MMLENHSSVETMNNLSVNGNLNVDNEKLQQNVIRIRILVAIHTTLFLLGQANLIVMFLIAKTPQLRTITNIYSFNLCLAEYLYSLVLPFLAVSTAIRSWAFDEVACKFFFTLEAIGKFASLTFITVLSVDRYAALCHPTWCKNHRTFPLATTVSSVSWMVILALVSPILVWSKVLNFEPKRRPLCTIFWPTKVVSEVYMVTSFVLVFAVPLLVVVTCYVCVLKQLVRANTRAKRLKRNKTGGTSTRCYRKVTKVILAIITFFVICWTPFWVQNILTTFIRLPLTDCNLKLLFNFIHILPYTNCALNPFLYAFLTQDFRNVLKPYCIRARRQVTRLSSSRQSSGRRDPRIIFNRRTPSVFTSTSAPTSTPFGERWSLRYSCIMLKWGRKKRQVRSPSFRTATDESWEETAPESCSRSETVFKSCLYEQEEISELYESRNVAETSSTFLRTSENTTTSV